MRPLLIALAVVSCGVIPDADGARRTGERITSDDAGQPISGGGAGPAGSAGGVPTSSAGGSAVCSRNVGGADYRPADQFVTSVPVAPDFGGITGATRLCNIAALGAGLAPRFRAWMTSDATWPGAAFINDRELNDGPDHFRAIGCEDSFSCPYLSDEHGQGMDAGTPYWAGYADPCRAGASCNGWSSRNGTGTLGLARSFSLEVADQAIEVSCAERHRLLCRNGLERWPVDAGVAPLSGSRRLFVTRGSWAGDLGGLAGADQRCEDAARQAGIPGTFRAYLGEGHLPASDRFQTGTGPWKLRTGAIAFRNHFSFATSPTATVTEDEFGQPLNGGSIWTGSDTWLSSTGLDCAGWTASTGSGTRGRVGAMDEGWTNDGAQSCASPAHLLCLER